jgi:hypothetical protein
MRSAIFSLLPVRRGSTIASIRIGRWLSIQLGIPLHDDDSILSEGELDNLFIINGSTLYCKHLPAIAEAVRTAKNVIWVQNDYTLPPPKAQSDAQSPFRKAFADRKLVPHYWTTCEQNAAATPKSAWVNWNCLAYNPSAPRATLLSDVTIYYGAYREGRSHSFDAMIKMSKDLNLFISSTSDKFPEKLRTPPFRGDLYDSLAQFGMGVYAQDKKSINGRHSPATRFYEMLSVGLPIAFMTDCVETLRHYGYDVAPYVLKEEAVKQRHEWAQAQQQWINPRWEADLSVKVKELYGALN